MDHEIEVGHGADGSLLGAGDSAEQLVTVRDRVKSLVAAGRDESQILAEHPTAAFDTCWGHGRVQPEQFVREIYSAIKTGK